MPVTDNNGITMALECESDAARLANLRKRLAVYTKRGRALYIADTDTSFLLRLVDEHEETIAFERIALDTEIAAALATTEREATKKERERCAQIAGDAAKLADSTDIRFVTPGKYASDLARDIADAIRAPLR